MSDTTLQRRAFLKSLTLGACGAAASLAGWGRSASATDSPPDSAGGRPPNVVLIFTDDQGTLDLGCYGAPDLHTPHIDALARRGVRFTQFYVTAPVCSPSRATLLTGRYPLRAGLNTNAWGDRGLPPEQITIAEMMRDAGYRTALFGKWHLGDAEALSPNNQGFDEFFGHKKGCIDNYSHFFYWSGPNLHDLWRNDRQTYEDEGRYFPDLIVREARRFIHENRDRPFFLYLPFNGPHYPEQPRVDHREMYAHLEEPRRSYAAFMTTLDEKIGRVVQAVDQAGLRDDTIIVFLSDHGHSVEERANFGGGYTGPFRGHKFTLWEGGIRVPCIVSWPGRVPENETRDQMAFSADWFPTLLAWCGAPPAQHRIDGADLTDVVASDAAPSPHRTLHWLHGQHWAVREGDWKLVHNGPKVNWDGREVESDTVLLVNIREDPGELHNLANQHPDVVERLTRLHEDWRRDVTENQGT